VKLFDYLGELERAPMKLPVTSSASEGLIESLPEPPTYKYQEHYLYFDHDFDNYDDDDNGSIVDKKAESILLLQGVSCFRRLMHMSEAFTNDAREQSLLQGPKSLAFVKTLY